MASYLQSMRDFLYRRRRPFLIIGGVVGGVYMAANYAVSKLGEMQRRMVEERRDRDNLKRRFAQNQDDCTYTILALLPTLGDQLAARMDVEDLTARLQGKRVASTAIIKDANGDGSASTAAQQKHFEAGEASSKEPRLERESYGNGAHDAMEEVWKKFGGSEQQDKDTQEENRAASLGSGLDSQVNGSASSVGELQTETEGKQMHHLATDGSQTASTAPPIAHSSSSSSGLDGIAEPAPLPIRADARLTPSPRPSPVMPNGRKFEAAPGVEVAHADDAPKSPVGHTSAPHSPIDKQGQEAVRPNGTRSDHFDASATLQSGEDVLAEKRTKLALWNELKRAALSRAITALYGVVLLSLQTHVQLNVLGRYAYLTSVSSLSSSGPAPSNHQIRLERYDDDVPDEGQSSQGVDADEDDLPSTGIDLHTERLYLTLSWWLLHRGWKHLADLVETSVDEVFGNVGLKTPLTHADLSSMLRKVRRRIEYEGRGHLAGLDDDATTLGASMASFDGRSEWSEATTLRSGFGARARGKRRDFSSVLFPPAGHEMQVLLDAGAIDAATLGPIGPSLETLSPALPALLDETRDIFESDDFWRVMKLSLRQVFATFESELRPTFGLASLPVTADNDTDQQPSSTATTPATIQEVDEAAAAAFEGAHAQQQQQQQGKSIRLASLFPAVARQSVAVVGGGANAYVDALSNIKELKAFCAVIYAAWE